MTEINLDAYAEVLGSRRFFDSLALTVYVAGASTVIATTLAVLAALALRRAPGGIGSLIFQVPITVPHLMAAVGIAFVVGQTGLGARLAAGLGLVGEPEAFPALLYDRYSIGVILTYVWKEVPFIALVVLAGLRGVASELEDVARTLGANAWQRFWFVVFPVIAPGIVAASLVVFAFTFGAFEVPYLLGQDYPTVLPVAAYEEYQSVDLADRPVAMAINVLMALVTALFAAGYLRLSRGWGRG
ncbi:ABC-type spermidine/putrescine transport system permease component I [Rubrobacter radiotolerans]|uniref:ABC transporter permease subunit n=1 Tax=Rubrobacter radiotolerans TaxID=42256 RepID=A0A023X5N7_RUBRA|nr:ABC transporter permease subunit [Rubrobacter radiotolerans]AHY47320.1 ABC-type spermidine/putrescine transport system permease component I [Rubrobacter radiotolerans]MDX5894724.1 ABC transporter permease subunit [Rubrobacter radiotolerans]